MAGVLIALAIGLAALDVHGVKPMSTHRQRQRAGQTFQAKRQLRARREARCVSAYRGPYGGTYFRPYGGPNGGPYRDPDREPHGEPDNLVSQH